MEIRPVMPADLQQLEEIDGTIESSQYLHIERSGEGMGAAWKIEDRRLREKRILPNRLSNERSFVLKQIVTGADDGIALLAEHEGQAVALLAAQPLADSGRLHIHDLRVDYEFRRQGIAAAMIYQLIATAREQEFRAVSVETLTDNFPAAQFFLKCGFELSGLDAQKYSNHDLVKEAVALFWYIALD